MSTKKYIIFEETTATGQKFNISLDMEAPNHLDQARAMVETVETIVGQMKSYITTISAGEKIKTIK